MKMTILSSLRVVLLTLTMFCVLSAGAQKKHTHVIQPGETLYRITVKYKVTAEAVCAANPGLSATYFPTGMEIVIPSSKDKKGNNNANTRSSSATATGGNTTGSITATHNVKASIILPFGLDEKLGESPRMLEFYQGFLLALDTLKKQGVSVDLHVYDTGKEGSPITSILNQSALKESDVIFGGFHWGHAKQLSDFSRENGIQMVLPFSANAHFVENNPYLFMINTPQENLYPTIIKQFKIYFPNPQVFFLDDANEEGKEDKRLFVKQLKAKLDMLKVPYETISQGTTAETIAKHMKKKRQNVFIPLSGKKECLDSWLPTLLTLLETNPDKKINLFGYPEWQTFPTSTTNNFYLLDTYIYTAFYSSSAFKSAREFKADFARWYHKKISTSYPQYAMLGYDLGLYFISAASRYGKTFPNYMEHLNDVHTIQNGFSFTRLSDTSGFINNNVYYVHFTPDSEIIKTELK